MIILFFQKKTKQKKHLILRLKRLKHDITFKKKDYIPKKQLKKPYF
jgi:hypothetical protein